MARHLKIAICGASALGVTRPVLRRLIRFVAAAEGRKIDQVDLAVVDAREMARLNRRHLGRRGSTDVLSFDLADRSGGLSAQVLICADVVARQARHHGHSRARELALCIVHGLLHLTGHDDATPTKAAAMHARQEQLLAEFTGRERRSRRG
jgi:probable rRNA maturation factor